MQVFLCLGRGRDNIYSNNLRRKSHILLLKIKGDIVYAYTV